jgi:hypothetical protein
MRRHPSQPRFSPKTEARSVTAAMSLAIAEDSFQDDGGRLKFSEFTGRLNDYLIEPFVDFETFATKPSHFWGKGQTLEFSINIKRCKNLS